MIKRWCRDCNEKYEPTAKYNNYCNICLAERLKRRQINVKRTLMEKKWATE